LPFSATALRRRSGAALAGSVLAICTAFAVQSACVKHPAFLPRKFAQRGYVLIRASREEQRDAVARAARDMHGRLVALRERPLLAVRIGRDEGESADKLAAAPEFSDGWVVQSGCVRSSSDAA
jgi:hypothetical protein